MEQEPILTPATIEAYLRSLPRRVRWPLWLAGRRYLPGRFLDRDRPLEPPRWPWEVALVAFELARRHRFLGDLFHGATTSGLRHRVSCPVLTVRSRRD